MIGRKWAARKLTRGERNAGKFFFSTFFPFYLFFCASYARVRDAKRLSIVYYVMYDDGSEARSDVARRLRRRPNHDRLRIRRFFHRWRPEDLDKAGASSCASSSPSAGSCFEARYTQECGAIGKCVAKRGTPRLVTIAGCGRTFNRGRRKNLFREKLHFQRPVSV